MARLALAALVAVAALQATLAFEEDEGVLVFDDDNFDDGIKQYAPILVEFYAPWCGHCKRLAPEYAKAAQTLKADGMRIAKVDATVAKEVGGRFNIQGFPTLKFFTAPGAPPMEYNGGREAESIVNWIRKKSGPTTKPLTSAAEAKEFAARHEVALIGFVKAGGEAEKVFGGVAATLDDVAFATTDSDEVRAEYGIAAGKEGIVAVNTFEGQANRVTYTGALDNGAAITAFADANSLPLVIPFTQESAPKIFRGPIKTHYLLFVDPKAAYYEGVIASFRAVAAANQGKALFVTVDPSQDRVISYFGVTPADMPTAVFVSMPEGEQMKKFVFPKATELTEESLKAFLNDYFAGKLKPFLKSEEVPADESTGPVTTVVGTSFERIALDPTKDVLLEFYAPWCGHCKQLAPEYERLGARFKESGVDSVVIAKMDATANEVEYPGLNIRGFPTIVLFPATSNGEAKRAVEFDGSRDINGFITFLKRSAAKPFTLTNEDDLEL